MNVAYSEALRPPKELFSREWYAAWDSKDPWEYRTARIHQTKKKLEELEKGLRIKIKNTLMPNWKGGGYTGDLLVDTVTFLNSNICVWRTMKNFTSSNFPYHIEMIYPRNNGARYMSMWEEVILGGVQREGICLSMLSPQSVEWLNILCHWVSE